MKSKFILSLLGVALSLWSTFSSAGPLDPDCTAEKAAKSSAAEATVGVALRQKLPKTRPKLLLALKTKGHWKNAR
jgi:hypothetical protein